MIYYPCNSYVYGTTLPDKQDKGRPMYSPKRSTVIKTKQRNKKTRKK